MRRWSIRPSAGWSSTATATSTRPTSSRRQRAHRNPRQPSRRRRARPSASPRFHAPFHAAIDALLDARAEARTRNHPRHRPFVHAGLQGIAAALADRPDPRRRTPRFTAALRDALAADEPEPQYRLERALRGAATGSPTRSSITATGAALLDDDRNPARRILTPDGAYRWAHAAGALSRARLLAPTDVRSIVTSRRSYG